MRVVLKIQCDGCWDKTFEYVAEVSAEGHIVIPDSYSLPDGFRKNGSKYRCEECHKSEIELEHYR